MSSAESEATLFNEANALIMIARRPEVWSDHGPEARAVVAALQAAEARGRTSERAYIVEQIRENAATLTLFAGGRALDLLAWILELPPLPPAPKASGR